MSNDYKAERKWNKKAVDYFNVLSWHLPGGSEENHKKLTSGSTSKSRTAQYKA
jgi:hypothetical protein